MTKDEINSLLQQTISYEEIQLLQDNDNGTKLGSSPIKDKKKVENKLEVIPEQEKGIMIQYFSPMKTLKYQ